MPPTSELVSISTAETKVDNSMPRPKKAKKNKKNKRKKRRRDDTKSEGFDRSTPDLGVKRQKLSDGHEVAGETNVESTSKKKRKKKKKDRRTKRLDAQVDTEAEGKDHANDLAGQEEGKHIVFSLPKEISRRMYRSRICTSSSIVSLGQISMQDCYKMYEQAGVMSVLLIDPN